jgi:hypothetical protein
MVSPVSSGPVVVSVSPHDIKNDIEMEISKQWMTAEIVELEA